LCRASKSFASCEYDLCVSARRNKSRCVNVYPMRCSNSETPFSNGESIVDAAGHPLDSDTLCHAGT
jgi:hypothetical protein